MKKKRKKLLHVFSEVQVTNSQHLKTIVGGLAPRTKVKGGGGGSTGD